MSDWFSTLAAGSELSMDAAAELQERGFIVLPGPVPSDLVERLANAYTAAVASATADDAKIGSTSSRVSDFVNREPEFDPLYIFPPLLEACCLVIGRPFKLSSFHARTVRPRMPAQELHVDVKRESADWPLLGFILMVDEFRPDNGATRFVPGSHRWPGTPADCISNLRAEDAEQVLACGCAGSLLVFNGSAWHGHGANTSSGRAGPSKARLFRGTGAPGPTSRPVCNPRRARDSGHSRGRCSHSDRSCLARGGSDTRVARSNNDLQPTAAGAMMRRCG